MLNRIGLSLALVAIGVISIMYSAGMEHRLVYSIPLHLLLLLIAIFIGIYNHRREEQNLYLSDVKAGMRQVAVYVLVISAFTYLNYRAIDKHYLDDLRDSRIELVEKGIEDEGGWEAYLEKNSGNKNLKEMTKEDFLDQTRENFKTVISPGALFIAHLVAGISIGFIYSLILAFTNRFLKRKLNS